MSKENVTLNYPQGIALFQMLERLGGDGIKGAETLSGIGRLWETVGLQIGALKKDEYGEPVRVPKWKPEL